MKNPASKSPGAGTLAVEPSARTVLVLIRHGDAGDALALPERDALRPLTPKGIKQARRVGKALIRMGLVPGDVWTSRLLRSGETALHALARVELAPRVTPTEALTPDAIPERILRVLADTPLRPFGPRDQTDPEAQAALNAPGRRGGGRRAVNGAGGENRHPIEGSPIVRWVVGHEPHLGRLAALATGAPATALRFRKGSIAVIEFEGRRPAAGTGILTGLLDPDALRALSRRHGKSGKK